MTRLGTLARDGRLRVVAVSLALLALMVVAVIGSIATEEAAAQTQSAVTLNRAYQKAASGVAAEESLERKYRLEPGPTPLAAHVAARQQVSSSLASILRFGGQQDQTLALRVQSEHAGYVRAAGILFAAVDRHQSSAAITAIDNRTVDPVFSAMQNEIYAAAATQASRALEQSAATHGTGRFVLAIDVATLAVAMTLMTVVGVVLTRSARRLRTQSDLNAYQALHDTLTGLPNRTLFQDRTAHALQAARRHDDLTAVMLVDLDRFKDVNDTLGHHYGDLLLRQVADRFTASLRAGDSVARFGGDEFAVLLCSTSAADAVAAATRLTKVLEGSFAIRDISLDVEASIGIALAGPDTDVDTALRHADIAMYEAKTQHLPYATYELSRDDNTIARLALLGDLRRAISQHELVLEYQPKVSTTTREVHSVEALVRWQHPTRGLLMPDAFIPIAEGTAVIHPLTDDVLRQALVQARDWRGRAWTIPVSVNISARSLHDLSFPGRVRELLRTTGVPADGLILELTEGAIMTDPRRALAALEELNAMGICLSIDDFGTGYSSMSYLKELPVRELKIDRSFVIGMAGDESDRVIVQSAVDLGHNLGLHVVAEGVEDASTEESLTAMGCDLVQGYHICRPASAADLDQWLVEHASTTSALPDPSTNV